MIQFFKITTMREIIIIRNSYFSFKYPQLSKLYTIKTFKIIVTLIHTFYFKFPVRITFDFTRNFICNVQDF